MPRKVRAQNSTAAMAALTGSICISPVAASAAGFPPKKLMALARKKGAMTVQHLEAAMRSHDAMHRTRLPNQLREVRLGQK